MVADRDVLVVGQQRVVGAEQAADVGRVVDAGVEVGVVADARRQAQCCSLAGGSQPAARPRRARGAHRGQQRAETADAARGEVGGRCRAAAFSVGPCRLGGLRRAGAAGPERPAAGRSRTLSPMATPMRGAPSRLAEDAERQVLDREVRMTRWRRRPRTAQGRIVGFVELLMEVIRRRRYVGLGAVGPAVVVVGCQIGVCGAQAGRR